MQVHMGFLDPKNIKQGFQCPAYVFLFFLKKNTKKQKQGNCWKNCKITLNISKYKSNPGLTLFTTSTMNLQGFFYFPSVLSCTSRIHNILHSGHKVVYACLFKFWIMVHWKCFQLSGFQEKLIKAEKLRYRDTSPLLLCYSSSIGLA